MLKTRMERAEGAVTVRESSFPAPALLRVGNHCLALPTRRRLSTSLIVSQFRRPVQPRSVSGRAGQRIHPGLLWRDGEWGFIKYIKDQDLNLLLLSSIDLVFVAVYKMRIQLLCNMKL